MRKHSIDFKEPSGKGETVTVESQAGDIMVSAGLVHPPSGRTVVVVEADIADGWEVEVVKDQIFGKAIIRLTQR